VVSTATTINTTEMKYQVILLVTAATAVSAEYNLPGELPLCAVSLATPVLPLVVPKLTPPNSKPASTRLASRWRRSRAALVLLWRLPMWRVAAAILRSGRLLTTA
jgi:hypothetical protein